LQVIFISTLHDQRKFERQPEALRRRLDVFVKRRIPRQRLFETMMGTRSF